MHSCCSLLNSSITSLPFLSLNLGITILQIPPKSIWEFKVLPLETSYQPFLLDTFQLFLSSAHLVSDNSKNIFAFLFPISRIFPGNNCKSILGGLGICSLPASFLKSFCSPLDRKFCSTLDSRFSIHLLFSSSSFFSSILIYFWDVYDECSDSIISYSLISFFLTCSSNVLNLGLSAIEENLSRDHRLWMPIVRLLS
mgnify:CR=1 FL=1